MEIVDRIKMRERYMGPIDEDFEIRFQLFGKFSFNFSFQPFLKHSANGPAHKRRAHGSDITPCNKPINHPNLAENKIPSITQVIPRAKTASQRKRLHGSRSIRDGSRVLKGEMSVISGV